VEHGESRLLVPIDDASALAAAIARVIGEGGLRAELVAGGRAAFEAAYTEKAVVARYLDFFERVTR
jgi:glycosyltransferase involved in cell wall biosynthesis